MNTKIIKFDINKNLYDTLIAKQGDTKSRFLLFNLLDGSIPFSLENRSVRVYAIKPDGTEVFNDLIITDAAKGYCILELTTQMLAVAGTVKLELMVIEGEKKLTSNIFYMDVKKSINSEKAVVSTNEFGALLTALSSLNEYDNYKKEIAAARDGEANLLTKVKKIDEQLDTKTNKTETNNIQGQIDALVLGAVGDGNNAEVVQARTNVNGDQYLTLKRRNDDLENIILNGKAELFPGWRLGFVNVAGEEVLNAKIITSVDFIDITDDVGIEISIANGFQYTVHYLTSTGELRLGSTWYTDTRIFKKNYANKIKISILSSTSAKIEDSLNIKVTGKVYETAEELKEMVYMDLKKSKYRMFLKDIYKYIFKNCICIGDSLTRGYYTNTYPNGDAYYPTYPQYLQKITGWTCTNAGRSGATAKQWYDERINLFTYTDKDIAIIYLGTNYGLEDTIESDTSNETNAGSYCRIIERLQKDNPKMKIFLCTVSNVTYDTDGSKVGITNNVIRKIANKYNNCYCIELKDNNYYDLSESVCHPHNDEVHLGSIGYNLQANVIAQSVSDIVMNNISDFEVILDEIH